MNDVAGLIPQNRCNQKSSHNKTMRTTKAKGKKKKRERQNQTYDDVVGLVGGCVEGLIGAGDVDAAFGQGGGGRL